jgi:hypothetical protein
MDFADLTEEDLRSLFEVMKNDHPNALASGIVTLMESGDIKDGQSKNALKDIADELHQTSIIEESPNSSKGCYLHYDASSAKLKLQYSTSPVSNAIGFYSSRSISAFKYKKNFGRADLIGNCAAGVQGRKNYYSGWCQFIRAARSALKAEEEATGEIQGELWIYPRNEEERGLDVDIYVYDAMAEYQTIILPTNKALQEQVINIDAVACFPKHSDVFEEVKQMELNRWLTKANSIGATSRFTVASGPENISPNLPISLIDSPMKVRSSSDEEDCVDDVEVPEPCHGQEGTKGCYLLYDSNSGKLKLQYSDSPVRHAIGFYCAGPGHSIRGFKFTKNFGRADLIGNCASGVTGRKNYYSGWCQFIRAARSVNGPLWIYEREEAQRGLDVDIYVYYKDPDDHEGVVLGGLQSVKLEEGVKCNISGIDAVTTLPRHTDFFSEVKQVDMNRWMTAGNNIGATSRFE